MLKLNRFPLDFQHSRSLALRRIQRGVQGKRGGAKYESMSKGCTQQVQTPAVMDTARHDESGQGSTSTNNFPTRLPLFAAALLLFAAEERKQRGEGGES